MQVNSVLPAVVKLELPFDAYQRLRELVLAAGKYPATGENGIHSASQLLLFMDQQVQAVQLAEQKLAMERLAEEKKREANGAGTEDLAQCSPSN
jgi:hypothetical protein